MSKRLTSFLLGVVAAVLLTVPSNATVPQGIARQAKVGVMQGQKKAIATQATIRAIAQKNAEKTVRVDQLVDQQRRLMEASIEGISFSDKAPWHPQRKAEVGNNLPANFKGRLNDNHRVSLTAKQYVANEAPAAARGPRKNVKNPEATVNAYGIITSVDPGDFAPAYYTRTGTAYYVSSNQVYSAEQSGNVEVIIANDEAYIKDPVSRYTQGSWVKGTIAGNTITVAAGQPLAYNTNYSTTLGLYWGNYDESTEAGWNKQEGDITFTINEEAKTITLEGSNENLYIGIFWDDDNSFAGYGDYETVWTLNEGYEPPSEELVVLPEGAEVLTWYREQTNATSTGTTSVTGTDVKVAFVGSDVYVAGIFTQFPDAWIKGTIDGTTVTFAGGQFVGYYDGSTPIWAFGTDESALEDFTMTYDAAAQSLISVNELLANAAVDRIYYLQWIESLALYAEQPAPAQIDQLPYSNGFDDAALQRHFTVIDANGDGTTWGPGTDNFAISYADTNDDWLVSPAIKLVAGKKYHFAIDAWARSATYPETFEVRIAAEATAEALAAGAVVIEQQAIANAKAATFENDELTVAADGYYYIGIHNTSADKWMMYVDNFLIEGAPISAPYTGDLTVAGTVDDFFVIDNNEDGKTWSWSATYGAYYSYSTTENADDYLVLPIKLEAGKGYNVIVTAAAAGASYPEKFEVKVGKAATVEDLNITAIAETIVNVTANTEYDGSFTTDEAGTYYVAIHAISDADQYQLRVKKLVIEAGAEGNAPAAVDNFAVAPLSDVLGATLTFTAPTKTLDGSDLAAGDITKIEILRNGAVINTIEAPAPGAELTYVDQDPALTIGNYKYQVITYGASGIGGKSEEISVFLTAVLTVPYTADFTVAGTFDAFQVINNNDDSSTWQWNANYGAYYSYNSTNQADDYLVSSPILLEAGKNYKVTINAKSASANYAERFEVKVGKAATAADLNITAIAETNVTSVDFEEYEGDFTVSESGEYFVAIHAISDPDMWRLQVNTLTIEKGLEPNAPAAPELAVVAGAEGALNAAVTVVAPAKSIDGNTLPAANLTKIDVLRDGEVITSLTAAPGATVNYNDETVVKGNHTYQAIPYDANGDAGQKSEKQTVFVGVDDLADVTNVQATNDAATITFTWDAVTGQNGGYVNQTNVTYQVYSLAVQQSIFGAYLVEDEAVSEPTSELTATINYPIDEGEQQYLYFGVKATDGVSTTDATTSYAYVFVGAPEELPIFEGFAGSTLHYNWNTNGGLGVSNNSSDGDGVALKLYNDGTSQDVYLLLEKLNLKSAANPTLVFDVRSEAVNQVYAIGSADGGDLGILAQAPVTADYTTVKAPLASIRGERYSTVGIYTVLPTPSVQTYEDTLIIDNIKIVDLLQYNVAVDVKAPKSITAGQTAVATVTVTNTGENAAQGYTVKLTAGDEVLLEETVNDALGFYETKEFAAEYATTIFSEAGDVTLKAEVVFANDLDEDDNVSETVLTVNAPSAAAPTDVVAVAGETEGSVSVTWNAPENATQEVTEDVESYDDNDNGGLDADVHVGQIGEWTVYDGNEGKAGYGFNGVTSALGNPGSFLVFNPVAVDAGLATYAAHSGDKYFISACVAEPENAIEDTDHWLISPELPGVAQTVKFWVRELVTDYGAEKYEILASSTDKEISSFTLVESKTTSAVEWEEISVDLPEGTKYFAIRHISNDVWALLVDDIVYLAGGGEVASYNVYLDETYNQNTTGTAAAIENVEGGDHKISVTAVYSNGSESAPVSATISIETAIEQLIATGKPVNVYTVDGKLVRQNVTTVEGLKTGLYIVDGKKAVVK